MTYGDVHVVPEPGTVEELGALDDVPAVHTVPGEFDPIAQQLASKEDIPDVVGEEIHAKSGVLDMGPSSPLRRKQRRRYGSGHRPLSKPFFDARDSPVRTQDGRP